MDSIFTIETLEEKNQILSENKEEQISGQESNSNSKHVQKRRRSRIDSGLGLDLNNSIDGCTGEKFRDIFRSKLNKARRMSLAAKSKQKKVVSILVLITTMFTIVNIPSAISRIMSSPENKTKESFQVYYHIT